MATKNIPITIDANVVNEKDRIAFYLADSASAHPGALHATLTAHVEGNAPRHVDIRFEDATPVLDGEGILRDRTRVPRRRRSRSSR